MAPRVKRLCTIGIGAVCIARCCSACSKLAGQPKGELSDGKLEILDAKTINVSTHYKFVKGSPRAGRQYMCRVMLQYPGGSSEFDIDLGDGSAVAPEGQVQRKYALGTLPSGGVSALAKLNPGDAITASVYFSEMEPRNEKTHTQTGAGLCPPLELKATAPR
jgi:hypothetical protein